MTRISSSESVAGTSSAAPHAAWRETETDEELQLSMQYFGDVDALREFLRRGGDPNGESLERGVSWLLFAYVQASFKHDGSQYDDDNNDYSFLRVLIESGGDANFVLAPGTTMLKLAAMNGMPRLLELLLKHGADPNVIDTGRISVLTRTLLQDDERCPKKLAVMKLLIAYGATIDLALLHHAIHHSEPEVLGLLLTSSGIDANETSNANESFGTARLKPLLRVAAMAKKDASDFVRVLLRRGASIDVLAEDDYDSRLDGLAEADGPALKHLLLPVFWYPNTRRLLSEILTAGSWKRYVREPCVDLLLLRVLCQRGRASAPRGPMKRLFSASFANSGAKRAARGASLPDSLFWVVLSYWRSSRQVGPPDHEADDDELQAWMADQG